MRYNPRKQPEMAELTSFADAARVVYRGHKASKYPRDSKIMGYNPRKRPEIAEITSFADPSRVVYLGHRASKSPRDSKIMRIAHENDQKWPKSRVLPMSLVSCTGGHKAS